MYLTGNRFSAVDTLRAVSAKPAESHFVPGPHLNARSILICHAVEKSRNQVRLLRYTSWILIQTRGGGLHALAL